jgi:hypothetical protein
MFTRSVVVVALATLCHCVTAQAQGEVVVTVVPPPLAVQRLAPQLVAFAGSDVNFQNLVNGLSAGTPVQMTTTLANGFTQTVTFTPAAVPTASQIALILETARQRLISLGIGAPTAEQIAFTLMGGVVPTALGGAQVSGLANGNANLNPPSRAAQQQQQQAAAGAGATAPTGTPVTNTVNVQTTPVPAAATAAVPRQTSDSAIPAGATSRGPAPVTSASPVVNTSNSPIVNNTSNSPILNNTSNSPLPNTPIQAPGAGSVPATPATMRPLGR